MNGPDREALRRRIEHLLFGDPRARRYTQDSPILPDVWIAYGLDPLVPQDLLLTPHHDVSAGHLARVLRDRLAREHEEAGDRPAPQVAFVQGAVVATLGFEELLRVVLPMTPWWQRYLWRSADDYLNQLKKKEGAATLAAALEAFAAGEKELTVAGDLLWMVRVVGFIARLRRRAREGIEAPAGEEMPAAAEIAAEVATLVEGLAPPRRDEERLIWLVNRNRDAAPSLYRSTLAVKADAARRVFEISCAELAWAVVDSGIDARHPAFRRHDARGRPFPKPFVQDGGKWRNRTRVVSTYDFTRVRPLLDPGALGREELPAPLAKVLQGGGPAAARLREQIGQLRLHLLSGREIDWHLLEPVLEVPHDDGYLPPQSDHGTHVAGIVAADWPDWNGDGEPLEGVCPDLELYDLRVLDERGRGDEFSVIAALQFLRYLNAERDHFVVHGANLSLSIHHDVANYACGRTPVCDETERVIGAGVVVVAAAGNRGFLRYETVDGPEEGYHTVSITDPGNAQDVITVGATHRYRPHTYGVSYFSSRGPTGDGRVKPDLVAPGEKVVAPVPDEGSGRKDGTSMAAPHVSGAAALLMARHRELAGDPSRVKEILCATATDLGRERYFQGCGLVDVLRALQAV